MPIPINDPKIYYKVTVVPDKDLVKESDIFDQNTSEFTFETDLNRLKPFKLKHRYFLFEIRNFKEGNRESLLCRSLIPCLYAYTKSRDSLVTIQMDHSLVVTYDTGEIKYQKKHNAFGAVSLLGKLNIGFRTLVIDILGCNDIASEEIYQTVFLKAFVNNEEISNQTRICRKFSDPFFSHRFTFKGDIKDLVQLNLKFVLCGGFQRTLTPMSQLLLGQDKCPERNKNFFKKVIQDSPQWVRGDLEFDIIPTVFNIEWDKDLEYLEFDSDEDEDEAEALAEAEEDTDDSYY